MFKLDDKFLISNNLLIENLGNELIILKEDSSEYFAIEGIGLDIWSLISKDKSFIEIVEDILEDYDVDRDTLLHDISEFINSLLENGLIYKRV